MKNSFGRDEIKKKDNVFSAVVNNRTLRREREREREKKSMLLID